MRNKNTVIFLLIVFTLICGYNLYYTYVQFSYDQQYSQAQKAYVSATNKAPNARTADDSLSIKEFEALRDDEEFQASFKNAVKNSFTLGLDLQGGMFVTLEVGIDDVVRQLAGNTQDSVFNKAVANAVKALQTEQEAFVPLFIRELKALDPNASLGAIFADPDRGINIGTPEAEVITFLNDEANAAIDRTFQIIRKRIDQFGVVSPNLQKQSSTGRILLELPGVKDPDRVRDLLRSTAKLEFWETQTLQYAFPVLIEINEKLKQIEGIQVDTAAVADAEEEVVVEDPVEESDVLADANTIADSLAEDDSLTSLDDVLERDSLSDSEDLSEEELEEAREKFKAENPLFGRLNQPNQNSPATSAIVGYATSPDTAQINAYFRMEEIQDIIPEDLKFLWEFQSIRDDVGEETDIYALYAIKTNLEEEPALGGDVISDADQNFDQFGNPIVSMKMNPEGSKEWARITEANVQRAVAIVLDNKVYSAPIVQDKITGGSSQITLGSGDSQDQIDEATDLANVLKSGQLPVPARIQGEDVVGPTLGAANIRRGMGSFIGAIILMLIFMAIYYAKSGLVANVALIANMVFILGCSAAFTIVLTLPGIAAMILTIGMAVDANVLIFERIREELAKEKTLKASIKSGFSNAFSSVMDANITTFLTGAVLFAFGIGPIRGFAVSLMIGIITSLISALIITRLILDFYSNKGKDSINFGFSFTTGLFNKVKIQMVSRKKLFYGVSAALVIISLASIFINNFKTGVDFRGGRQFQVEFVQDGQAMDLSDEDISTIRTNLTDAFEGDAPIVKTMSSNNQLMITSSYKVDDRDATEGVRKTMIAGIQQTHPYVSDASVINSTDVGPTMASDIQTAAFESVIGSLIIIFLYILLRFRKWQYSLGAIAAIFHDVIIVLGIFSLLGTLDFGVNLEVNQNLIAALLTIIGYSINDTVVVFDRIRENFNEMKSRALKDIYNISIDQTISRTLITSVTTFITALTVFLYGGDTIKGMFFAILIGIIVGTYSSVFVASPISMDLIQRSEKQEG